MKKQIFLITLLFTILVYLAVNLSHIITLISDLQSRKTLLNKISMRLMPM